MTTFSVDMCIVDEGLPLSLIWMEKETIIVASFVGLKWNDNSHFRNFVKQKFVYFKNIYIYVNL